MGFQSISKRFFPSQEYKAHQQTASIVSKCNWNPVRVVSMDYMFYYNKQFNTAINNWNIGNVKSMKTRMNLEQEWTWKNS